MFLKIQTSMHYIHVLSLQKRHNVPENTDKYALYMLSLQKRHNVPKNTDKYALYVLSLQKRHNVPEIHTSMHYIHVISSETAQCS